MGRFTPCQTKLALIASLVNPACGKSQPSSCQLSAGDRSALEEAQQNMTKALLAGDWKSAAAGYAEDAVRLPPGAGDERGRAAIQASLAQMARPIAVTVKRSEVEGCGNLAYAWFTFSITWPATGAEKPPGYGGREIVIFRKQLDGRWLATRAIFNSDQQ